MIDVQAYRHAAYPPSPWWRMDEEIMHLSDEDVAALLDKEDKHRRRARKSAETRKRKQVQQHD